MYNHQKRFYYMCKKLALLSVVFLVLVGCNKKTMSALGLKKSTPDEFSIIPNKPLTIPPMFDLKNPDLQKNQHNTQNYNKVANNDHLSQGDKKFVEKFSDNNNLNINKKDYSGISTPAKN